jgi:hypothetical protein
VEQSGDDHLKQRLDVLQQKSFDTSGKDVVQPESENCVADNEVVSESLKQGVDLDRGNEFVLVIDKGKTAEVDARTDKTLEGKEFEDCPDEFNCDFTDVETDSDYEENNLILLLRSTEFRQKCKENLCTHCITPAKKILDIESSSCHSKPDTQDPKSEAETEPEEILTSIIVEQEESQCFTPTTKFVVLENSSCHDGGPVIEDPEHAEELETDASVTAVNVKQEETNCFTPTSKCLDLQKNSSFHVSKSVIQDPEPETETEPEGVANRVNVEKEGTLRAKGNENNPGKLRELRRATPFLTGRNSSGDFFTVDLEEPLELKLLPTHN